MLNELFVIHRGDSEWGKERTVTPRMKRSSQRGKWNRRKTKKKTRKRRVEQQKTEQEDQWKMESRGKKRGPRRGGWWKQDGAGNSATSLDLNLTPPLLSSPAEWNNVLLHLLFISSDHIHTARRWIGRGATATPTRDGSQPRSWRRVILSL